MSTVIRDAIVRLKLEQQKTSLQAPDMSATRRGLEEEVKARREVEKATKETTRATVEHTRVTQEFSVKSVAAYREAGEGAFRMARGIALLSASGSDDLQKLIQKVAMAQGAFDVFAGGSKIFTSLASVLGGPVAIAITGVSAALTTGALLWQRYTSEADASRRATDEARRAAIEFEAERSQAWQRQNDRESGSRNRSRGLAGLGQRFGATEATRERAFAEEEALLREQSTDLQRDAKRRLRGFFKGKGPGGLQGDFNVEDVIRGGTSANITNAFNIEKEREQILRRQLEIDREQFELQRRSVQERQQSEVEQASRFSVVGAVGTPGQAVEEIKAKHARTLTDMATELDRSNEVLFQAIRKTAARSEQLGRELEAGANSR